MQPHLILILDFWVMRVQHQARLDIRNLKFHQLKPARIEKESVPWPYARWSREVPQSVPIEIRLSDIGSETVLGEQRTT